MKITGHICLVSVHLYAVYTKPPTNPTEVCVACSDNALRFLSLTSMKVDCVIQGVRPSKHEKRDVEKYTATSLTEAAISNGARDIETALDNTQTFRSCGARTSFWMPRVFQRLKFTAFRPS